MLGVEIKNLKPREIILTPISMHVHSVCPETEWYYFPGHWWTSNRLISAHAHSTNVQNPSWELSMQWWTKEAWALPSESSAPLFPNPTMSLSLILVARGDNPYFTTFWKLIMIRSSLISHESLILAFHIPFLLWKVINNL